MDSLTIILLVIIFFLVIALFYSWLTKSKVKNQEQANNFSIKLKENNELETNSTLELKAKVEEIYQKLIIGEEVNKTRLENVDKGIKEEIINQQKLIQEKNKELSEKINKDLEVRLNNNQQLIKTHLENLNKGISQPLEKLNNVLLHSGKRGR